MSERLVIQMSPKKEEKEKITRIYKEHGIKMAGRVLKLILSDVEKLEEMKK